MKKLNYLKFFSVMFLIVGLFHSCKKKCQDPTNPDCQNYDPCYGIVEANADFSIFEVLGEYGTGDTLLSETDSIYFWNPVLFKPKYHADKISWILGAETIAKNELFRKWFPGNSQISVTMISEIDSSKYSCLHGKKLNDSLTKIFYSIYINDSDDYKNMPYWGTWEGINTDNPGKKLQVSFGFINRYSETGLAFAGLPE